MQPFDKKDKINKEDEDDSRQGSQGGVIEFHDFISLNGVPLTAEDERLKLLEHKGKNSSLIDKQKQLRDQRELAKNGKSSDYQYGNSAEQNYGYEPHPIISQAAEFSGDDPQVNMNPNDSELETNSEKEQELTYQHQLRHQLQNERRFIPPTPRMS